MSGKSKSKRPSAHSHDHGHSHGGNGANHHGHSHAHGGHDDHDDHDHGHHDHDDHEIDIDETDPDVFGPSSTSPRPVSALVASVVTKPGSTASSTAATRNARHDKKHRKARSQHCTLDATKAAAVSKPLPAHLEQTAVAEAANPVAVMNKARRQLWIAALLCGIFMVAEFIGGIFANSLSLMTDAAHLLSDLAGFLISLFSLWVATFEPTSRLSFGFHRAEILGALLSVMLIWALTGVLVYEAITRLIHPSDVDGRLMFFVALGGLCVNVVMGFVLHQSGHGHSHFGGSSSGDHGHSHGHGHGHGKKPSVSGGYGSLGKPRDNHVGAAHDVQPLLSPSADHDALIPDALPLPSGDDDHHGHGAHGSHENINVKAAFIHVLGDAIQSIGVMIAGGLIWYNPKWRIADPLCTFLFSLLVLATTIRLVKQSVSVLMEGVPEGIDPDQMLEDLYAIPGVKEVHDLHIWSLSVGKPAMSAHILGDDDSHHRILRSASQLLADKYRITHSTIQVEAEMHQLECGRSKEPIPEL